MKIVVTGSAGFIGFHLCLRLLKEGHSVVGIDNLNEYYAVEIKQARHTRLAEYAAFTAVNADLCDYPALEEVFDGQQVDLVCNLAAQAGVRYSLINPFAYQKSNVEGFLNVLELCRKHQVKRLVYASSSSVYGGAKDLPFCEDQRLDTPISLYAATKKANELMAYTYTHLYGLETVGLRFFTVYGPWGRPDMALWIFAESILAGKPIEVYNFGEMKRDFTYIDDIIEGVRASLLVSGLEPYSIFNLGNHRCEELSRMIELLEGCLAKKAIRKNMPIQPGDVPATYADIGRAQSRLGFSPSVTIDTGIAKFVEWYMAHPDLAAAARKKRQ